MHPGARTTQVVVAFSLLLFSVLPTQARFGRNKIQYKNLEWQVLTTPHFEIHFYQGSERFAARAGLVLEDGYQMLSQKLNDTLPWRVPVILYGSHNDFLQTNIQLSLIPEGVQAFAEPSRKRIVLPFTGSYPAFAHTAIHELAHVFTFNIVYNRLMDNVFSRNALFGMPLWIAEGFAEYLAVGWDAESDMFIRDAVIHDYLSNLNAAAGFMVYKGGQSAFNYIEDTYGREKVLEIVNALAMTRNADGALERTVGLTTEEFSAKWKKAMRKHYWPMYGDKTEVEDLGRRLTNHLKDRAYYNTKPVMSPDGERIAFFSDRDGLISIFVMSTLDGKVLKKLVSGHRSNRFESLHFYTSSIAWSPDGRHLAFVAKSDGRDQVYIVDSHKGSVQKKIDVRSDGLAAPTWSPDGEEICISAVFGGQTDLLVLNVESGDYRRLTNDVADQLNPRFFPDGKRVAFAYYPDVTTTVPRDLSAESKKMLHEMDFLDPGNVREGATTDIYEMDIETGYVRPLVQTAGDDQSPVIFDEGRKMIFTSDLTGIRNLYVADLETGEYRRLTDVLSGVMTPDVNEDKGRITFSAFVKAGYDIYVSDDLDALLEEDFGTGPTVVAAGEEPDAAGGLEGLAGPDIPLTTVLSRATKKKTATTPNLEDVAYSVSDEDSLPELTVAPRLREAVADKGAAILGGTGKSKAKPGEPQSAGARPVEGIQAPVGMDEPESRGASVAPYRFRLAPDYIGQGGGLYFSTGFGFGLANTIALSDLLGNHRAVVSFNIYRDIVDSDLYGAYYFLKKRVNYGFGAFQYSNYLNSRMTTVGEAFPEHRLFKERNYGVFGLVSYPFDTFNRLDLELQAFVSERQFFEETLTDQTSGVVTLRESGKSTRNLIEPQLSYVHDGAFFSYFGPIDGSRYRISVSKAFGFEESGVSRSTLFIDYRKYKKLFYRNSLAFRLALGASEGDDPQAFFLGGPSTIRGYDYLAFSGSRLALTSIEYRFPFLDALVFGWPGRWGFGNMMGSVFVDAGATWDKSDFRPFDRSAGFRTRDLLANVGVGTSFYFGYFLLNFQIAWQTDFAEIGHSQFYFFIGPGF